MRGSNPYAPKPLTIAIEEIVKLDERSTDQLAHYFNRIGTDAAQVAQVGVFKNNRITTKDLSATLKDLAQAVAHARDIIDGYTSQEVRDAPAETH